MIIFLYGEDTFRSREKLKQLKDKFRRDVDPDGNSLITIDGETAVLAKINEAVAAPSLFSKKRMIVIERIFANKSKTSIDAIHDYFKKRPEVKDDNIIIFWDDIKKEGKGRDKMFKFLDSQQFTQEFKAMSNVETANWIRETVKARGGHIKPQAVTHLAVMFGGDLWSLNNEINKLINYKKGQQPELVEDGRIAEIEIKDIEEMSRGKVDENIFALTDAIGGKNKAQAFKLLEQELEAGVADIYLLYMITRQFRIMLLVKQALERGHNNRKIASLLKIHPFVAQKSSAQVNNFSLEKLKDIFHALVKIDSQLKTGKTDLLTAMELLIVRL